MKNQENFRKEQPLVALGVDLTEEELQGVNGGDAFDDFMAAGEALELAAAMDRSNAVIGSGPAWDD